MNTLFNQIIDLNQAREYIHSHYGSKATLEVITYPNTKGKPFKERYHFVNVPLMRHYTYTFKSVAKAINCLIGHELKASGEWKRFKRKDKINIGW
jgi:hypothetical protein